jgi:hypothetical protein
LDEPTEWRNALQGVRHGFAHTWEHCRAIYLTSNLSTFLYELHAPNLGRFVCPIAERTYAGTVDVVTPYGFSGFVGDGDAVALEEGWRRAATRRGYVCGFMTMHPVLSSARFFSGEMHSRRSVDVIDLTRPMDELYRRLHCNRRRELRNWAQTQRLLLTDRATLKRFLAENYRDFIRQKGATSAYNFNSQTMGFLSGVDNVLLVGVRKCGEVIAASMFGYTKSGGDYLFNVAKPGGRSFSSALIWYAVTHLQSLGVPHLNLGGGIVEDDGVAAFKKRFGAVRLPLRYVKQVYDRPAYVELCVRSGADPDDMMGYFPPYRRP